MYFDEREMFELWSRYSSLNKQEIEYFWRKTTEVINGVIYTHRFQKYGCPFEDIQGVAIEAVLSALTRFNPEFINKEGKKTTLFNYISLVAKRSIMFYTLKQSAHHASSMHENQSIEDIDIPTEDNNHKSITNMIIKTIKQQNLCKRSESIMINMAHDFNDILITKRAYSKREMFSILKQKYIPGRIRQFIAIIENIKKELYDALS